MFKKLFKYIVITLITLEARLVLKKYHPAIIAVTGSVGKTSTKDAITDMLQHHTFVRGSAKSYNSDLGVPLTILGCSTAWSSPRAWIKVLLEGLALILFKNHYPNTLVLEVGVDHPGDIRSITKWLRPDVVVVTRIGDVPVHVEFFESREQLIDEKTQLVAAVKEGGTVIVNADDPDVLQMAQSAPQGTRISTFGFSDKALVRARDKKIIYNDAGYPEGLSYTIAYEGTSFPITLFGSINDAHLFSSLAACATARAVGGNIVAIMSSLSRNAPPAGRGRILEGVKDTVVIDDSYNASPTAVASSLEALREIKTEGRKIVVLGDMTELGKYSLQEHEKLGVLIAGIADMLVTVGHRSEDVAAAAHKNKMRKNKITHFHDAQTAGAFVQKKAQKGDVILIKGSQSMRMERAVKELLREPERAGELLVRQEPHWLEKK